MILWSSYYITICFAILVKNEASASFQISLQLGPVLIGEHALHIRSTTPLSRELTGHKEENMKNTDVTRMSIGTIVSCQRVDSNKQIILIKMAM